MEDKYNIEKLKIDHPDFFDKIDEDLLDYVVSEEFATAIARACLLNDIKDNEVIEKVAYWTTWVFLGSLPETSLFSLLEKKATLEPAIAQNLYKDIDKLVLSQLEDIELEKTGLSARGELYPTTSTEEKSEKSLKKDAYREIVE